MRVDHDISLLIPELFSRMSPEEREAGHLIAEAALEPVPDFEFEGKTYEASRLGYRMTKKFTTKYFGRIFLHPHVVFSDDMLAPELQDPAQYASSVETIVTTHERVAKSYFADGTVEFLVPPMKALLGIMAHGEYEGMTLRSPEFRAMFTRQSVLASDWYASRLESAAQHEQALLDRSIAALEAFMADPSNKEASERMGLAERLAWAKAEKPDAQSFLGTGGRQVRFA